MGAELVVLSPQRREFSVEMVKRYRIEFPMLRDFQNKVAAKFGVAFKLPDYLDALYRQFGNDPFEWNETETWQLPMPSRFILKPDGIIADSEVNPDYTTRPEPETMLEVLRALEKHDAV
jgi:peroxiredoxin